MEDMDKILGLEEIIAMTEDDDNCRANKSTYPRLSKREDLHVMMLLSELIDSEDNIITCSDHDIIYFEASPEDLAGKITRNQLLSMLDCGLFYDSDNHGFTLFT